MGSQSKPLSTSKWHSSTLSTLRTNVVVSDLLCSHIYASDVAIQSLYLLGALAFLASTPFLLLDQLAQAHSAGLGFSTLALVPPAMARGSWCQAPLALPLSCSDTTGTSSTSDTSNLVFRYKTPNKNN